MEFKSFLEALTPVLVNALVLLVTYIFANLGQVAKGFIQDASMRKIAETTVQYVEQVYKNSGSEVKFEEAKKALVDKFNAKGFSFTELDVEVLIESAVNNFYAHWDDVNEETVSNVLVEEPLESVGSE